MRNGKKIIVIDGTCAEYIKTKEGEKINSIKQIKKNTAYDVKSIENAGDSTLLYEGEYFNKKKHGKIRVYTKKKENFNLLKGEFPVFNEKDLSSEENYNMGFRHGVVKEYEKGKLQTEEVYEFGSLLQQKIIFPDNSYSLVKNKTTNHLQLNDCEIIEEYNSKGDLIQTITIKNQEATIKDNNKKIVFEGGYDYKNKKKIGIDCKDYNSKGEVVFKGEYRNGYRYNSKLDQDGKPTSFKESNNGINFEGVYKNGTRIGFFRRKNFFRTKEILSTCSSSLPLTNNLFISLKDLNNNEQKNL